MCVWVSNTALFTAIVCVSARQPRPGKRNVSWDHLWIRISLRLALHSRSALFPFFESPARPDTISWHSHFRFTRVWCNCIYGMHINILFSLLLLCFCCHLSSSVSLSHSCSITAQDNVRSDTLHIHLACIPKRDNNKKQKATKRHYQAYHFHFSSTRAGRSTNKFSSRI